jgi:hypothetical protein
MKTPPSTTRRRGYTLLELTVAMSTGIAIAVLILMLVNQQIAFLRIFKAQKFLTTEAPILNNHLVKIISSAESFRLYRTVDELVSGSPPVMNGASVLMLRFKEPDGTYRASVIAFEDPGTGMGLYYRLVNTAGTLGSPTWSLSKSPTNVVFSIEQGILRVRVTGPAGEELVYSGSMQL